MEEGNISAKQLYWKLHQNLDTTDMTHFSKSRCHGKGKQQKTEMFETAFYFQA